MTDITLRRLEPTDVDHCAAMLESLPEWFGLPEANAGYVAALGELPGTVAVDGGGDVVGFVAVRSHTPSSDEIEVMAVVRDRHGGGIGRRLVDAAIAHSRARGARWLHVKTRGPSTYDDDYERTRRFYTAVGFEPLYESLTEWGPDDAALVLVMRLD
ncbi:MAG: GNAT family N-acetyltransferase [Acidimicrobiia bacterium]|nr:GNAT family N-acetyltransferase [Acidimicrobiia bacterium]